MKISKNYVIGGVFILLLIILGIFMTKNLNLGNEVTTDLTKENIKINNDEGELTVWRSGDYEFMGEDGSIRRGKWNADKTNAFFNYYFGTYLESGADEGTGGSVAVITNSTGTYTYDTTDDEFDDVVIDDENGGGDEGDDGEDDIDDYFGDPTPTPAGGAPTATPRYPTPTPSSPFENCLYWRLSYCVIPKPSPTPEPTAAPGEGVVEVANCEEWNLTQTSKTVINNTVCIPGE